MSETAVERDYLERTIETVRVHRDADNSWPQWANILADEVERLWAVEALVGELRDALRMLVYDPDFLTWTTRGQREVARAALAKTERDGAT